MSTGTFKTQLLQAISHWPSCQENTEALMETVHNQGAELHGDRSNYAHISWGCSFPIIALEQFSTMHRPNGRMLWWSQRKNSPVNTASSATCQTILRYNRQHHRRTHSLRDTDRKYSKNNRFQALFLLRACLLLCTLDQLNIYRRDWRSGCLPRCPLAQLSHSQVASWRVAPLPGSAASSERQLAPRDSAVTVTHPRWATLFQPPESLTLEQALTRWCLRQNFILHRVKSRRLDPFLRPRLFSPPQPLKVLLDMITHQAIQYRTPHINLLKPCIFINRCLLEINFKMWKSQALKASQFAPPAPLSRWEETPN